MIYSSCLETVPRLADLNCTGHNVLVTLCRMFDEVQVQGVLPSNFFANMLQKNLVHSLLSVMAFLIPQSENFGLANVVELLFRKFNYHGTRMDQSFFQTKPILAEYDFIVVSNTRLRKFMWIGLRLVQQ